MSQIDLDQIAAIVAKRVQEKMENQSDSRFRGNDARSSSGNNIARGSGGVDSQLAKMIDHTLLKPEASQQELEKLCAEAVQFGFASVCVNSSNVAACYSLLKNTPIMVCAVVGFPLGAMSVHAKAFETREAVKAGADEIDMVINIGALKDGNYSLVLDDIRQVVTAARPAKVKVILETSKLTNEQKVAGCTLSKIACAHFVKTSTGFGGGGATVEDIELMRRVVGSEMGVKASGGVRTAEDAYAMIAAGANRLGASAGVTIVQGGTSEGSY